MGVLHLLLFVVWFVLLSSPLSARESIRVLLAQDVPVVQFSADGRVMIHPSVRPPGTLGSRVEVRQMHGQLLVNGWPVHTEEMTVQGRSGPMHIGLPGASSHVLDSASSGPTTTVPVEGAVRVLPKEHGLMVINDLDLEEYVKGVVAAEM